MTTKQHDSEETLYNALFNVDKHVPGMVILNRFLELKAVEAVTSGKRRPVIIARPKAMVQI